MGKANWKWEEDTLLIGIVNKSPPPNSGQVYMNFFDDGVVVVFTANTLGAAI